MKVIKIKKSGKIFLEEAIGEEVKTTRIKSLSNFLACEVELEEGLTFGTLFKLILKEKDIFDIIFHQELNDKELKDFEKKLNEVPVVYEEDFKLNYLEVSKIFELFTFDKGNTIDLFSVFVGIGKTNDGFDVLIPLSFFSVSELKDVEIIQNKSVEVCKDVKVGDEDYPEENDDDDDGDDEPDDDNLIPYFEASTKINLYEILQCIICEIAYYRDDNDRISVRRNQNSEHINKNKIAILQTQLKDHIENEAFEKAAIVKRELDRLNTAITNINKN
jgi:hypothetical protein